MRNSTINLYLREGGNDDMRMTLQQPYQQDNHSETTTMRQQQWDKNNETGSMTAAERMGRASSHCMRLQIQEEIQHEFHFSLDDHRLWTEHTTINQKP